MKLILFALVQLWLLVLPITFTSNSTEMKLASQERYAKDASTWVHTPEGIFGVHVGVFNRPSGSAKANKTPEVSRLANAKFFVSRWICGS